MTYKSIQMVCVWEVFNDGGGKTLQKISLEKRCPSIMKKKARNFFTLLRITLNDDDDEHHTAKTPGICFSQIETSASVCIAS